MSTPVLAGPAALLALALLVLPARGAAAVRLHRRRPVPSTRRAGGPVIRTAAGAAGPGRDGPGRDGSDRRAAGRLVRRGRARRDPWTEAGTWDQLAACLRAGLPLTTAARAVAPGLDPDAAAALTAVADLVALGSDPADAWVPALTVPATARLARAARRSARTGAAVADVATAVAAATRAEASETVTARAERASVLVTGPLGLCFLPAFLALGIVPVVLGLAGPLLEQQP